MVFVDEKKFNLDGPDGFAYYFHDLRKEERIFSKRNFGGGSLMVFAAVEHSGTVSLQFVSTRMNSSDYQKLLNEGLLPFWESDCKLYQDNASIHVSKATLNWLAANKIDRIEAPPCSPDLNPMENVWGMLTRDVYAKTNQYKSVAQLKKAVLNAWSRLDKKYLQKLVKSMPDRIFEVIKQNGGSTKY